MKNSRVANASTAERGEVLSGAATAAGVVTPTGAATVASTGVTRRRFLELGGIGLVSICAGGLLSGCSNSQSQNASASLGSVTGNNNEVVIAMSTGSEPAAGFDPLFSWGCGEHVHEPLIQSTLITTDKDLNFVNDLATQYYCSDDGLMWTFEIRDDVKFSDGEPLTAVDVAFTINGIKDNDAAEADLSMVERVVATNDTTVEIQLNKPFNALLYTLAVVGIVPEHVYDSKTYGANPVGSGRYMLEQWDKGQQVILLSNPDYYGEAPKIERVTVVFMEEDAALAAVQAGEVDIAYTSATMASTQVNDYELFNCASVDSRGISLPSVPAGGARKDGTTSYPAGNDVTCNLAIRQAMQYALDRDALVANVLNGYGTPAFSVCDGMPWASEDMKVETNLDQATQIIEADGWVKNNEGVYEKNGQQAAFTLHYPSNDSVRQALAAEFANQMTAFGINVTIAGAGWDDLYPLEYSEPILWGWGSNSPTELYNLYYSTGWGNFACYDNQTVDDHLDAALAQPTIEDSYNEYKVAQWDGGNGIAPQGAATWIWLANIDHLYFKRNGLQVAEQKPHPHGHGWSLANNVDQWSWE